MRICFISRRYFPAISGMSVYARNLLAELVAGGHDVTMISQYRADAFGKGVYGGGPPPAVPGVRVIGRESRGEAAGGDFEADIDDLVATMCAEHARAPFDVLHAQYGYPPGYAALLASRRLGVPCVTSIQGGDGHWVGSCCGTHAIALRQVIDESDAVLIGGASFRAEVVERLGVDAARFSLVPGAVDTDRFVPRTAAAERASDPTGGPLLLAHGRVDRRKGVLDFIAALGRLAPQLRWRAVISGIGPDVEAARDAIAAANLDEHIVMRGYVAYDDAPALYAQADVFVSPTYAEGFSNTILEAMAAGLPIVSCATVGVDDCLRDGSNALLVQPGDIDALSAAIARLIEHADVRAQLGTAARDECVRTYSWKAVGRQIVDVYRDCIRRGVRSRASLVPMQLEACRFRAEPHLL